MHRDSYYADPDFVKVPAEGLLSKAYAQERAKLIDPKSANRNFVAGNPLPYDRVVGEWTYWVANIRGERKPGEPLPEAEPVANAIKDTTHIAIIDRAGNVFDSTPSGG